MNIAWICSDGCNLFESSALIFLILLPYIIGAGTVITLILLFSKARSKNKIIAKNARLTLKISAICLTTIILVGIFNAFVYERGRDSSLKKNLFPIYAEDALTDLTHTLYGDGGYSPPYIWFRYETPKGSIEIREIKNSTEMEVLFTPPTCNLDQLNIFVNSGGLRKSYKENSNDTCEMLYQSDGRVLYKDTEVKPFKVAPEYVGRIAETYILFTVEGISGYYNGTLDDAEGDIIHFMKTAQLVSPSSLNL
jgi:hypothetical protein